MVNQRSMKIVTGQLIPEEGKVEWAKHVITGYMDQTAILTKGSTIRMVLQTAFDELFEMESRMNQLYMDMQMIPSLKHRWMK